MLRKGSAYIKFTIHLQVLKSSLTISKETNEEFMIFQSLKVSFLDFMVIHYNEI